MTPEGRLPWERDGDGFIARPNGPDVGDHAKLSRVDGNGYGGVYWVWEVQVGGTTARGTLEPDQQSAANAATEAWHHAVADEIVRLAAVARRQALSERAEAFMAGDGDLDAVGIEDAVYEDLLALQTDLRRRWEASRPGDALWNHLPDPPERMKALMDALSAEFLRRRS